MNSYIYTGDEITVVVDSVPYTVDRSHVNFEAIIAAVKSNDFSSVPDLANLAGAIRNFGEGKITIDEDVGVVCFNNEPIHNSLTDRILRMIGEGFSVEPLAKFLENLMSNPSKRSIDELYTFLEYGKLPITDDGCFLAYKRVERNYLDCHSRTVLNKMYSEMTEEEKQKLPYTTAKGVTVEVVDGVTRISMPRNKVDDRSERTCSEGLHFCSLEYLKSFWGDHVMVLKINPRDVVSIPVDYNHTKGRCSVYEIIGEYKGAMTSPAFNTSVVNPDSSEEDFNEVEWHELGDGDKESGTVSEEYVEGYVMGYNHGRAKKFDKYVESDGDSDLVMGYVKGYKDGRGHKRRLYTLD